MDPMIENASRAVATAEVQEMIRRLADYGLGVFMPHLHPEEGGFRPLPRDVVQLERELQISFVSDTDPILKDSMPIGWVWDKEKARVACTCYCCAPGC